MRPFRRYTTRVLGSEGFRFACLALLLVRVNTRFVFGFGELGSAMVYLDVPANVFCRFDLDRLCITPELVGAKHEFVFDGMRFTLHLPTVDREGVPFEQRRLHLYKWQAKGNVPLEYAVHSLDVEMELADSVHVPEEVLRLHPNQFELFASHEQTQLNKLVAEAGQALRTAFGYWLRMLRWKSGVGYIGEPSIRYAGSGQGGAVLRERGTKHRMWLQGEVISVTGSHPVTSAEWNATQAALSSCKNPPVWFDFLFDSQMRINNKDFVGGVLSLAIALEVNLRFIFSDDLRKANLQPVVLEVFDLANMRALLTRLKKIRQWDRSWVASTDFSAFHRLMDHRDGVMHTAKIENLDERELRKMHAAVKKFAYFTCDALGLS
jgi:hypothetical protein